MNAALLDRDLSLDVRTGTGLLVLMAARPRGRRDWLTDDAALAAAVSAERLAVVDAGFPGTFRVRLTRHAPDGPIRATFVVRCGTRGLLAGDEEVLASADGGLAATLPRGRYRVDVRTPWSDDAEAPDYVLTLSAMTARAAAPAAQPLRVLDPADHPRPRRPDPAARAEAWARLQSALRDAGEGDLPARRAALGAYLRVDPRDARALALRAEVKQAQGELERALDDAWRATVVAPNDAGAWTTLARVLAAARRRAESARAAARAAELRPRSRAKTRTEARGRVPAR
jgi:hypothetical protein